MNKKGQALIEFVLILPIFLMILFVIVDFGNLLYSKNKLQNQSTDIARLIQNGENLQEVSKNYSNVEIEVTSYQEDYQRIILIEKIDLITPFLDRILGDPYQIKVERVIANAE
ncbi:MAG: pilus assembly protein [Erysipelotrichaceae bacterium]|nr:pilus assembly protein [Erysipelotrichaceae bacterium]